MNKFELRDLGEGRFALDGEMTFATADRILRSSEEPFEQYTRIEVATRTRRVGPNLTPLRSATTVCGRPTGTPICSSEPRVMPRIRSATDGWRTVSGTTTTPPPSPISVMP